MMVIKVNLFSEPHSILILTSDFISGRLVSEQFSTSLEKGKFSFIVLPTGIPVMP
jgi:hypothetical protein